MSGRKRKNRAETAFRQPKGESKKVSSESKDSMSSLGLLDDEKKDSKEISRRQTRSSTKKPFTPSVGAADSDETEEQPSLKKRRKEKSGDSIDTSSMDIDNTSDDANDSPMPGSASSSSSSSGKDEKKSSTPSASPIEWENIPCLIDEAVLPSEGLPAQWKKTKAKYDKIAFDPDTSFGIHIDTGVKKRYRFGFINSTPRKNPMPGAQAPAAVRYTLYKQMMQNEDIIIDNEGNQLSLCWAHGDYVKIESTACDHFESKDGILQEQKSIEKKLNSDIREAEKCLRDNPGLNDCFVKYGEKFYGRLSWYVGYYNDYKNIWLICGGCNTQKNAQDALEWLNKQSFYGGDFNDWIQKQGLMKRGILTRTADKKGLAEASMAFFRKTHSFYTFINKTTRLDILFPLQKEAKRADRIRNEGDEDRAERHKHATLAKEKAAKALIATSTRIPRGPGDSPTSSDDERHLEPKDKEGKPLSFEPEPFSLATDKTIPATADFFEQNLKANYEAEVEKRPKPSSGSGLPKGPMPKGSA